MITIKSYLRSARPRQWTKNLLVFSAPLFAYNYNPQIIVSSFKAFIIFCIISSSIYFLNDAVDLEKDKVHPKKRLRPIAKGIISKKNAIKTFLILTILGNAYAFFLNPLLGLITLIYSCIQLAYCFFLKNKPLLDIYCIASGFILRALAGGISTEINLSPWFILTIGLFALFLAIEKRKAELRFYLDGGSINKKVLKIYSLPLLSRLENIVSTGSFISYSLWAAGPGLNGAKTSWMLLTIPYVLYGIFRYQLLSDSNHYLKQSSKTGRSITTEEPEEILLNDRIIQINIITWITSVLIIFRLAT